MRGGVIRNDNVKKERIMGEDLQLALLKYKNKKSWFKSALLGLLIGLAVIVPGISGSTVAIIFKLYDNFLYAIGNLFKKFKLCFLFLLPIGIGLIIGFAGGFIGVKKLIEINLFVVVCLFAGLMSGAFPAVKDEIKGMHWSISRTMLFMLGLAIPVALGCVSAMLSINAPTATVEETGEVVSTIFDKVEWWHVVLAVVLGFAVGITQIVPGLSASALLMTVGWYNSLMTSVSLTYWKQNPLVFLVYAGLGVGFLLGIFSFSKLLTFLFKKARQTSYSMIVGLSLGSIVSMFCNGDTMEVYVSWVTGKVSAGIIGLSIGLGVVLFAAGFVVSYLLVRYERKKNAEATQKAEDNQA